MRDWTGYDCSLQPGGISPRWKVSHTSGHFYVNVTFVHYKFDLTKILREAGDARVYL